MMIGQVGGDLSLFVPLAFFVLVFWFLILRPQRKRVRAQQDLQSALSVGDEVRTIGGIHGRIYRMDDEAVVIDVETGRLRVARRAIASKVTMGED